MSFALRKLNKVGVAVGPVIGSFTRPDSNDKEDGDGIKPNEFS